MLREQNQGSAPHGQQMVPHSFLGALTGHPQNPTPGVEQTNIPAWGTAVRGYNPKEGALVHPLGWSSQPSAARDTVPC